MAVRQSFDLELKDLKDKLIELGSLAEIALTKAMDALKNKDIDKALQVIDEDTHADQLEEEINDQAIIMIARQSPVAKDLRRIIVAIKISADVERMADYAVNIAKETIRIGEKEHVFSYDSLFKIAGIAQEMLSLALQAYFDEDLALAKRLAEMDDQIDSTYGQLIREYLELSTENKELLTMAMHLSFIARFIERIGDHATNISEGIFYLVKGIRYDLNE
jgi:phosphate transport system protein